MIPRPGQSLNDLALRLLNNVAPDAGSAYGATDAALIAQLLSSFTQELEHGIASRMLDIQAVKTLFAAAPASAPGAQARSDYQDQQPRSLALEDVNHLHDTGMTLLIELHAWAELEDSALNVQIWALLRAQSERHAFTLP